MTPDGQLELPGHGSVATFVCAGYDYDLDVAQPLMSLLPSVLHVPADPVAGRNIAAIVELLASEIGLREAGARAATARLIDLLLIAAIRRWAEEQSESGPPSWLTALHDPVIGHVLALLHDRPAHTTESVESIARDVGHTSEYAFNRAFSRHRGQPPGRYRRLAQAA